ncbi:glycosyltransferase family 2 protein [Rarobacter faecitabidus]|nr:glycosyltransferase family 2 protein [Rarobacter faecitabidus]
MPVLNESRYLTEAVTSILQQEVDGESELILALGPSTDDTDEVAQRLSDAADGRIRLVRNPRANIPAGLNAAIGAAKYPVIVRVDAHCEIPTDYAARALATLERTGAANVGGIMVATGTAVVQRAVARAYNSKLGLGGPSFHSGGEEGPSESAYLGVFLRDVLDEVGMYDESVLRGEDWELNLRIRSAGYLVWFDPELKVIYRPRASLGAVARQFFATGAWRGELARRDPRATSLRYFAPPALVAAVLAGIVVSSIAALSPGLAGKPWWLAAAWSPALVYLMTILVATARDSEAHSLADRIATLAVLPTMHVAWGTGFWKGLLRGARRTNDRSRVLRP